MVVTRLDVEAEALLLPKAKKWGQALTLTSNIKVQA
jgi:hypothetical protein